MDKKMLKGIDVSAHNGVVDYKKVADAGYEFVIIRAGCGMRPDTHYKANLNGALSAGLKVGCYWFAEWFAAPEEEAKLFWDTIAEDYRDMTCGIWYDVEHHRNIISDKLNPQARVTGICRALDTLKALCKEAQNADFIDLDFNVSSRVGLYTSAAFPKGYLGEDFRLASYPYWVAHYGVDKPGYTSRYDIWQTSGSGTVPGVKTRCDLDLMDPVFLNTGTTDEVPSGWKEDPSYMISEAAFLVQDRVVDFLRDVMAGNTKETVPDSVGRITREVLVELMTEGIKPE